MSIIGNMTKEEFKVIIKAMKAVYTDPKFLPDADAYNVWFALLGDLPYEQVNLAVQKYMLTEKFPPTIADIRSKATELVEDVDNSMTELQAWSLVKKAICNSGYHAQEEFDKLPKACQIAVGSQANLREWGLTDSDQVTTVVQSHFVRNYRTAVARIKEDAKLPQNIKARLGELRTVLNLEDNEQLMIGGDNNA